MRNEEVVHKVKDEMNFLHAIERRKVNWIGHILYRNCLLKRYLKKDIGKNRSDGKRKKSMYAATGRP